MADPTTVQDPTAVVAQAQPKKKNQSGTWQGATREIAEELATLKDEFSALSALIISFMSGKGVAAPAATPDTAVAGTTAPASTPAPLALVTTPPPPPTVNDRMKDLLSRIKGNTGNRAALIREWLTDYTAILASEVEAEIASQDQRMLAWLEHDTAAIICRLIETRGPHEIDFDHKPIVAKFDTFVPAAAAAQKPVKRSLLRGLILRK
jgi:hypothetical protein